MIDWSVGLFIHQFVHPSQFVLGVFWQFLDHYLLPIFLNKPFHHYPVYPYPLIRDLGTRLHLSETWVIPICLHLYVCFLSLYLFASLAAEYPTFFFVIGDGHIRNHKKPPTTGKDNRYKFNDFSKRKERSKKKNTKKNTKNNIIIEKIPETVLRIEKTYIFLFEFRVASVLSSVFFPPKYRKEKNVEHLILNNEILPTRSCQRQ